MIATGLPVQALSPYGREPQSIADELRIGAARKVVTGKIAVVAVHRGRVPIVAVIPLPPTSQSG